MSNQEIIDFLTQQLTTMESQCEKLRDQIEYLRSITPLRPEEE